MVCRCGSVTDNLPRGLAYIRSFGRRSHSQALENATLSIRRRGFWDHGGEMAERFNAGVLKDTQAVPSRPDEPLYVLTARATGTSRYA